MYLQIIEQIRHRVAIGDWKPGHELPSIRALAVETRVSVITVKRAYLELERDGVIVTRQGKGSFVAENVDWDYAAEARGVEPAPRRAARRDRQALGLTTTSSSSACARRRSRAPARDKERRTSHERGPRFGWTASRRRIASSASATFASHSSPARSWASSAERRGQVDDDPDLMALAHQDQGRTRVLGGRCRASKR